MGLSLSSANQQANELNNSNEAIRNMRNKLREYQQMIGNEWKADEMIIINRVIEKLIGDLNKASTDLSGLSSDIVLTAQEIIREEEAARKKKASVGSPISKR